jgi:ATP-dependent Clp protease ATP-binding subunit ClpC
VLTLAVEEAKGLKHRYVGTEHLLLGLLREGEGVARKGIAARVLHELGLTLVQAREEVTRILGGVAPSPKSNVVMCRLDDRALEALDVLIEAGVRLALGTAAMG